MDRCVCRFVAPCAVHIRSDERREGWKAPSCTENHRRHLLAEVVVGSELLAPRPCLKGKPSNSIRQLGQSSPPEAMGLCQYPNRQQPAFDVGSLAESMFDAVPKLQWMESQQCSVTTAEQLIQRTPAAFPNERMTQDVTAARTPISVPSGLSKSLLTDSHIAIGCPNDPTDMWMSEMFALLVDDNDITSISSDHFLSEEDDISPLSVTKPYTSGGVEADLSFASDVSTQENPKRVRRPCSVFNCTRRSRSIGLCIAHGGGKKCEVEGCNRSSQSGNLCIRHGGGRRCRVVGCQKAAQTNSLCKAHGGGPRCQFPDCDKSAQGSGFCRVHGGGRRCAVVGCTKGTQRGAFCALHGGYRLCSVEGCSRNDRGGGLCGHHGGGRRCSEAGCDRPCRRNGLCTTHARLEDKNAGSATFQNQ